MKYRKYLLSILLVAILVACSANPSKTISESPNIVDFSLPSNNGDKKDMPKIKCAPDSQRRVEVRARHVVVEFPLKVTEFDLVNARAKALQARAELVNGESFYIVENKFSSGAYSRGVNGGDLGFFKRGVMVKEFEDLAFCLPVNQLSPIFQTDFGFHVLEVTEVKVSTQ